MSTAQAPPTHRAVLELRITADAVPPDVGFVRAGPVAVDRVGRILVPQRDQLIAFDPGGTYVGTVGRRGDGPGEFQQIRRIGWFRDSLWIYDQAHQRLTVFDSRGHVARTRGWPEPRPAAAGVRLIHFLPGERGLVWRPNVNRTSAGASHAAIVDTGYAIVRAVATAAESDAAVPLLVGPGTFPVPRIFGDADLVVPSPDGEQVVLIERRVQANARDQRYVVRWIAPDGSQRAAAEHRAASQPVAATMVDSILRSLWQGFSRTGGAQGVTEAEFMRGARRAARPPPSYPAVRTALAGRDGVVWVSHWPDYRRWSVLDSSGTVVATVAIPLTVSAVDAVTADRLWGMELQPDGDIAIVRYRLEPVAGPAR